MKKIIEFTVSQTKEVEKEELSTDSNGNQVKTIKKVTEEVPQKFFLRKPSRTMIDDASLFYGVRVAEGIKAGLLTIPLLEKRNVNDGGTLSDIDKTKYQSLWEKQVNIQEKYQKIQIKPEEEKTEADRVEIKELINQLTETQSEIQRLDLLRNSIFDNTAEVRARNLENTWWLLNLAYKENVDGKFEPFFGDGPYEKKLEVYDELADKEDEFTTKIIVKFLTYTSIWFNNRSAKQEDFERLEKVLMGI